MNKVNHFEIPADDADRASAFYSQAFNWQISAVPGMPYRILHTTEVDHRQMPKVPGAINGGMMDRQADIISPVITIGVDDIEVAAASIVAAGGTIVRPPFEVGDMGFAAYFTDTEANVMGLWQSKG